MSSSKAWTQDSAFQSHGTFWLPTAPDHQLDGILEWEPETGASARFLVPLPEEWLNGSTVHGTAGGNTVTLFWCWEAETIFHSIGKAEYTIRAYEGMLVGGIPDSIDSREFSLAIFKFDRLGEICISRPIQIDRKFHTDKTLARMSANWEQVAPLEASVPGFTVSLERTMATSGAHDNRKLELRDDPVLVVRPKKGPTSLKLLLSHEAVLRNLISFMARRPAQITDIELRGSATSISTPSGLKERPASLFRSGRIPLARPNQDRAFRQFLALDQTASHYELVLAKWYRLHKKYATVLELRFAGSYGSLTYSEVAFANAAQALEALHRRRFPKSEDSDSVTRRSQVLETVDGDLEKWLESRLYYAHEPTLKRRLDELVDLIGRSASDVIFNRKNPCLRAIIDTRNTVTHWDPHKPPFDASEAVVLTDLAHMIVDLSILRCLGYTTKQVHDLLVVDVDMRRTIDRLRSIGY